MRVNEKREYVFDLPNGQILTLFDEQTAEWLERLRADAERFAWWFGPEPKLAFVKTYLDGVREGYTLNAWRVAIDSAMRGENK